MCQSEINIGSEISMFYLFGKQQSNYLKKIETMPEKEIIVNFKHVGFSNRAFAHEYLTQKKKCSKTVLE